MRSTTRTPFLPIYLVGWTVSRLGVGMVLPLTALYLSDAVGLSVAGVSWYFAVSAVSALVVNPVAGYLCDIVGPAKISLVTFALSSTGPFFLAFAPTTLSVLAAALTGAGTGLSYAMLTPLLVSLFGEPELGRVLAAQNRIKAGAVAGAAMLGSFLVGSFGLTGYRICFVANGVSAFVYGAVTIAILRSKGGWERPGKRAPASENRKVSDVWAPLLDPVFRAVLVLQGMLVIFGFGQLESVLPIILRDGSRLGAFGVSVVLAVNAITVVALQGVAVRVVAWLGYVRALQIAVLLWSLSLGLLLWSAHAPSVRAALAIVVGYGVVFALGECLVSPSLQPLVVATAPPAKVAAYSASTSLVFSIGNLAASSLCLPAFVFLGLPAYLLIQLAGHGVAATSLSLLTRRTPARAAETVTRSPVSSR
ncbi:MFS transporter [Streptomyces canus]|uniref:MFS transporter n=1 Tax=Streptomyces canus TaxID=58343 RepID=UPI000380797A|nr:MFS transporter [Streptomyces canus]